MSRKKIKCTKRIIHDMISPNNNGNYTSSQYDINYTDELNPKKKKKKS